MANVITFKTLEDWNLKIEVPLENALNAAVEILGWSGYQACEKAIVYMAKSAGALTKVAQKLRPIVTNPAFKGVGGKQRKEDMRRARYGVYKYNPLTGQKYFVPIYRTGEYGKIRFISRTTAEWLTRDRITGEVHRERTETGTGEFQMAGVAQSKKRIIGRRGLAKRSWLWAFRSATKSKKEPIPGVVDLRKSLSAVQCGLILSNRMRYLSRITPHNLVDEVTRRATDSIMAQAAKKVEKKLSIEVPRLAASRAKKSKKTLQNEFAKNRSNV